MLHDFLRGQDLKDQVALNMLQMYVSTETVTPNEVPHTFNIFPDVGIFGGTLSGQIPYETFRPDFNQSLWNVDTRMRF